LSWKEIGHQNDRAVGKFQRVVMMHRLIKIGLTKPSQPIANVLAEQQAGCLYVRLECDLRPGTKADSDLRIVRTSKASSRRGLKFGRNQRFRDLRGTAGDRV